MVKQIPASAVLAVVDRWIAAGGRPHCDLAPSSSRAISRLKGQSFVTVARADSLLCELDMPWLLAELVEDCEREVS